jgi:hypothetical protein
VFHSKTGKEYKIFCNGNCKTPNVVYLLDCHVCGSQYVGESINPQEAERQLSNCRFYEKLDSDPTLDFTQKIMRALEVMHVRGHLDDKTMEYLTPISFLSCISLRADLSACFKLSVLGTSIHWSELRYLNLHRRSASVNHVVTSVASACQSHPTSAPATQSVESRARASFS